MAQNGPAATEPGPGDHAAALAAKASAAGDATAWFEPLYAAAEQGSAVVPWDRGAPHWMLVAWAEDRALNGEGRRALVVGCGLGADAEYIAERGFETVAFDISPTAVTMARRRYPGSRVGYRTADLLDPPRAWREAFDLVIESQTVQALPDPPRRDAITRVGQFVAPGGTLIVICLARDEGEDPGERPPWAITRAEIDAFSESGLYPARIDDVAGSGHEPSSRRWRAEFRRPVAGRAAGMPGTPPHRGR